MKPVKVKQHWIGHLAAYDVYYLSGCQYFIFHRNVRAKGLNHAIKGAAMFSTLGV